MAIIYTYGFDDNVQDNDAWVGTNSGNRKTKQFSALSVANYMNRYGRVSIGGQMSYKLTSSPPGLGEMTVIGGGDGTNFVDIEFLNISTSDLSGAQVTEFLDYLVSTGLLISHQNNPSTFGHYTVVAYTPTADPSVYKLELGILGGNGKVFLDNYYDLSPLNLAGGTGSGVTTVDTSEGSFITLTPTTPTAGNVLITADLSATGTPDATTFLRGDNTWAAAGEVDGSGTTNYVSKWQDPTTLTDSVIYDDGTNVGIGTSSPSEKLEVAGKTIIRRTGTATAHSDTDLLVTDATAAGSTAQLEILGGNAGNSFLYFSDTDSYQQGGIQYLHSSDSMNFRVNASTAMSINSSRNVGIGTTSPDSKLEVAGSVHVSGNTATRLDLDSGVKITGQYNVNSGNEFTYLRMYNGGDASVNMGTKHPLGYISFESGNGSYVERMRITNTGNVGIGTTNPATPLHVDLGTVDVKAQLNAIGGFDGMLVEGTNASYNLIGGNGDKYSLGALNNGDFRIYNEGGAGYALTLNNSGKLGIGTTDPQEKLDISAGNIRLDDSRQITWATTDANIGRVRITGSEAADNITFFTDNSERMRLTNTGLGIGTTSPAVSLDVNGSARALNVYVADNIIHDGDTNTLIGFDTDAIKLTTSGAERLRVNSLGNVGIGTTGPSQKLHVSGNARLTGAFYDSNNSAGTIGQVLTSTSTSTEWTDPGSITQVPVPITAFAGGSLALAATVNFVYFSWLGGSGTYTLNLPSAVTYPYKVIRFVTDGGTNANNKIHVTGSGGQTVDGGAFYALNKAYNGVQVWSDGSNWIVIQAKAT